MTRLSLFLLPLVFLYQSSIYDINITDTYGNPIDLGSFKGKKILFVNTAANSKYADQYNGLEQLYQLYKDSLVIIAFPTNSFGNEAESDETIRDFVTSNYKINYLLASKTDVKGKGISPLFQWLTQASLNGAMDNNVDDDFYKYLVNGDGHLTGAFAGSVEPMSEMLRGVIEAK